MIKNDELIFLLKQGLFNVDNIEFIKEILLENDYEVEK